MQSKGKDVKYAQKGFTLIELFIVIAIIAILVAAASPKYAEYAARVEAAEKQEQRIANCKENPTEGQTLEECVAS